MYNPLSASEEWIELYNAGATTVNLYNWRLGDERFPEGKIITNEPFWLGTGEYTAIGKSAQTFTKYTSSFRFIIMESGFPQLNNDADAVIVRDAAGMLSDSVRYDESWGNMPGISIERIRLAGESNTALNWSSCVDPKGGTPGRINSLFVEALIPRIHITASPNPFSPDGDGWEDESSIEFNLPMETANLRMEIYDRTGRQIKTLLNHQPVGSAGTVRWDGKDDRGKSVPIGIYIIFLEAIQQTTGKLVSGKAVIVVAAKL